ncbi:Sec1 family protein [Tritrichomonas foetus]|uniref:Sec1 family protein n=1 Tax=Tritrichomonas foetus TaxID=1144522 RepID=A0A1J4KGH1_9EUKA|nr:Sec1 family protein [Tritrichomonas foetus]|eukprot:OHT08758.1 Sec1 family protein [Tritrichomonas foetus]
MTAEIVETQYTIFQTIAGDEMRKMINTIPEPRIISYSKKNYSFIRRAIPETLAVDLSKYFPSSFYLEDLANETSETFVGSFCAFCLDDVKEVQNACEALKHIPKCTNKYLILIPRITTICQQIVDQSGLDLHLLECPLEIIPLEEKMFLVPSPHCFARCFIDDDINDVYTIARSLLKLQLFTGGVERSFVAGNLSNRVYTLLEQMKNQCGYSQFREPTFDDFFIIDRTVDLVTPLASQFYYGGLLDDKYEIDYGFMRIPDDVEIMDHPDKKEILLSDLTDVNYKELRGATLSDTFDHFKKHRATIEKIKVDLKEKVGTVAWGSIAKRAQQLTEEQPFALFHERMVTKILAERHFMTDVYNYEYGILIQNPPEFGIISQILNGGRLIEALRLLCFASIAGSSNIPPKVVEEVQQKIINQCGFSATQDLISLEKAGLLTCETGMFSNISFKSKVTIKDINSALNVLVAHESNDNDDDKQNQDIQNGYDGYVPIIHRLVQHALRGKWVQGSQTTKLMNKLGIPYKVVGNPEQAEDKINKPRKVLVFVIGGVTPTEICLFNEMSKVLFRDKYEFHVGTTNVTNGQKLIKSICPVIAEKSK